MISYIAMQISMDGTTPLGDILTETDVTLVLLKVYNRVAKMRALVITLYFHLVSNISMQLLYLSSTRPKCAQAQPHA